MQACQYFLYLNSSIIVITCVNAAFQTVVLVPSSIQTIFTARAGDTAVLRCPITPGALLQSYSVKWMKDNTLIAGRVNSQNVTSIDPERYDIDNAYSLLIRSINANDSSSNYQCVLFVTFPRTGVKQEVRSHRARELPLTLKIIGICAVMIIIMIHNNLIPLHVQNLMKR